VKLSYPPRLPLKGEANMNNLDYYDQEMKQIAQAGRLRRGKTFKRYSPLGA